MADAGLQILVAVVGGYSADPSLAAAWRASIDDYFTNLARRYPHSALAILATLQTPGERLAAQVANARGLTVFATPGASVDDGISAQLLPDSFLKKCTRFGEAATHEQAVAECLCRYAHIMMTFQEADPPEQHLAGLAQEKWSAADYAFGDEEDDNDAAELLSAPCAGSTIQIELPNTDPESRAGWRYILEGAPLAALDGVNRDLADAQSPRAAASEHDLLSQERRDLIRREVAETDGSVAFLAGIDALTRLFARTDASAINSKLKLDIFVLGFAACAPLAVFAYELSSAAEKTPLGAILYLVVILVSLVFGGILLITSRQTRQNMSRLAAEFLRVQFFWRLSGVNARVESTLERWMPGNHRPIQMIARSIDFSAARCPQPPVDLTQHVHAIWVGPSGDDPVAFTPDGPGSSQTVWYSKKARALRRQSVLLVACQIATFVLAMILAALVLLALELQWRMEWLAIALPIAISALPALAGAFSIYRERASIATLAENYERMARTANTASKRLDYLAARPNAARRRRVIEQFGREVIGEACDWLLANTKQTVGPVMGG